MSEALSLDLRTRVLAGVREGLSHRAAGARFGVGAASVSRWRALDRRQGDARPKALGGDRRSGRLEAHRNTILALLAQTPELTIEELRRVLGDRGLTFGFGTIQRFFIRHAVTRKKDRARQRTGSPGHPEAARGLV
jgi:transposase